MGIFDIFKNKKTDNENEFHKILDKIIKKKLNFPVTKFGSLLIDVEQNIEFTKRSNEQFELLSSIQKDNQEKIGIIKGYHPDPKSLGDSLMAVVEWPVYGKAKKTYVTDCTLISQAEGLKKIILPASGSWINFIEIADKIKGSDGNKRNYALAVTHLTKESVMMAVKSLTDKSKN